MSDSKVYTLYQIANLLKKDFQKRYYKKGSFYMKAEIEKLNKYNHGNCYPELIWKENNKIVAKMSGVINSYTFSKIQKKFNQYGYKLQDGMLVVLKGHLFYDKKRGIRFNIQDVDIESFLGSIEKQKQEVLKKLNKMGILEKNKLKSLPALIKNIAVISVSTGKGYQDFKYIIDKSGYNIKYSLFEASMQGANVSKSIINQLKRIGDNFDVVVIIRGGGAESELIEFSDFNLVKEICNYKLPVLSAIGHSSNKSVLEIVSNKDFITPTHLANFIVDKFKYYDEKICNFNQIIDYKTKDIVKFINQKASYINNFKKFTINYFFNFLDNKFQKLIAYKKNLGIVSLNYLSNKLLLLDAKKKVLVNSFTFVCNYKYKKISFLESQLLIVSNKYINLKANEVDNFKKFINLADLNKNLDKGYSIVWKNGKIVKNLNQISVGDILEIQLKDGTLKVKVI